MKETGNLWYVYVEQVTCTSLCLYNRRLYTTFTWCLLYKYITEYHEDNYTFEDIDIHKIMTGDIFKVSLSLPVLYLYTNYTDSSSILLRIYMTGMRIFHFNPRLTVHYVDNFIAGASHSKFTAPYVVKMSTYFVMHCSFNAQFTVNLYQLFLVQSSTQI